MAEPVRSPHDGIGDAGFRHGVAGIRHHDEIGLGPGLVKFPRRLHRRDHIIAALDDDARNTLQPEGILEQLAVAGEEAAMNEIVALDPREGDGETVCAKLGDALAVGQQRECGGFPLAPRAGAGDR